MIPNRIIYVLQDKCSAIFDARYPKKTSAALKLVALCTTNKNGRCNEHILEEMAKRIAQNPQLLNKRREIVEHPFGTFWYGYAHFLVKGLDKVKAEFSLMSLAYNIKRAINIVGVSKMVDAVG